MKVNYAILLANPLVGAVEVVPARSAATAVEAKGDHNGEER
jgi:hypothetical protein